MFRSDRFRLAGPVVLAAVLGLAAPPPLRAQLDTTYVVSPATTRADAWDAQAEGFYSSPRQWRRAAALHELAATSRDAADPRRAESLIMAAHLLYAVDDVAGARQAMEEGADAALARGDIVRAAEAWLDAASLAGAEGNAHAALDLLHRATALASSPLLADGQRARIMTRARAMMRR